ncbi:MAG TPA: stage V sporulation protein AE [Desulfobacteria bacterium]|nr:stage V sporulation protein AE [Desulfobacteria bacterium]
MVKKYKVILVTDGDKVAARTLEVVAARVGGSCISASQGNPTILSGEQIVELIKQTNKEPVLVMVDDRGKPGKGQGETVLQYLANDPNIEILGTVAVASNSYTYQGVTVDFSVDRNGELVPGPVDKYGYGEPEGHRYLEGDTVEVLNELKVPIVIGTGDIGKMDGKDDYRLGAEVTTRAVREIMARSEDDARTTRQ